jgi:anti-anti-sigma regulatory factor
MSAVRIITMWTTDHKVHVGLRGEARGDLAARLDRTLDRLLQAGATHMIVHLERLTGDDAAVLDILATTGRTLWLRMGIMETVGLRDTHFSGTPDRTATREGTPMAGRDSDAQLSIRATDGSASVPAGHRESPC